MKLGHLRRTAVGYPALAMSWTASLRMPRPDSAWMMVGHVPSYLSLDLVDIRERARRAVAVLGEERCEVCVNVWIGGAHAGNQRKAMTHRSRDARR